MILSLKDLSSWRDSIPDNQVLVVTNGCFDILHVGHLEYLEKAKSLGDYLLVGINGDESIRLLKGDSRPINRDLNRARIVSSLKFVDATCVFPEKTATNFLLAAEPNIYVKGGDYTLDSLNKEERQALSAVDSKIIILPYLEGFSTTEMLKRIIKL